MAILKFLKLNVKSSVDTRTCISAWYLMGLTQIPTRLLNYQQPIMSSVSHDPSENGFGALKNISYQY